MKKFNFLIFIFLFAITSFAATPLTLDEKVNIFYDRLMDMFSYNKYRDFYDSHVEKTDISFDDFKKNIEKTGIVVAGRTDSKIVGFEKKGGRVKITLDIIYKSDNSKKRVALICYEKSDRIIVPYKELKRIYYNHNKRRKK